MNTKESCLHTLHRAGIDYRDAVQLRRISMQLHRWYELECGDGNGCVERDETTGKTYWLNSYTNRRSPTRDMETSAIKRLNKVMEKYPQFVPYLQTDPRGCALYIVRRDDIPANTNIDSCYNRGMAVYK